MPSRSIGYKTAILMNLFYFLYFTGQSIWRATFHNFAVDTYRITPIQMGMAFSMISMPGLGSALLGLIGDRVRLVFLLFLSSCAMGCGLIIYGLGKDWFHLISGIFILHIGFAVFYPSIHAIFLSITIPNQAAKRLSTFRSIGPLSGIVATALLVFILPAIGYPGMLVCLGCLIMLTGGIACHSSFYLEKKFIPQNQIRLDKRLIGYYGLHFLNGCRSGLFKTFVLYYLVSEFDFQIKSTASIVLLGNLMTFIGYHLCGLLSTRYSPSQILVGIYLILVCNFLGFFHAKTPIVLCVFYLIDSLVFCTPAMIDSHLKFICRDRDLMGNLAMGLSLYHLGGIAFPALGGMIYTKNSTGIFFFGSVLALISLWICLVQTRKER